MRIPILDIKNRSRNWWISGTSLSLATRRPKTSFKSLIPIAIIGTTSLCLVLTHWRNSANFNSSWVSRIGGNLSISSKDLVYQSRTWKSTCMRHRLKTLNPKPWRCVWWWLVFDDETGVSLAELCVDGRHGGSDGRRREMGEVSIFASLSSDVFDTSSAMAPFTSSSLDASAPSPSL